MRQSAPATRRSVLVIFKAGRLWISKDTGNKHRWDVTIRVPPMDTLTERRTAFATMERMGLSSAAKVAKAMSVEEGKRITRQTVGAWKLSSIGGKKRFPKRWKKPFEKFYAIQLLIHWKKLYMTLMNVRRSVLMAPAKLQRVREKKYTVKQKPSVKGVFRYSSSDPTVGSGKVGGTFAVLHIEEGDPKWP